MSKKTNHIAAVLAATSSAPAPVSAAPAKPSRLAGFAAKSQPATQHPAPAKAKRGATADALKQLAKGDW